MKTFKVYYSSQEFKTVSIHSVGYSLAIVKSDNMQAAIERVIKAAIDSIDIFSVEEFRDDKSADEIILLP